MQDSPSGCVNFSPNLITGLCDAVKELLLEVDRLLIRTGELERCNFALNERLNVKAREAGAVGAETLVKAHSGLRS